MKRPLYRPPDGRCINEECCAAPRDIFADDHSGTNVCQLCGMVQSMYSTIVYEEDKRTFGEDKDGEKGADHRRTARLVRDRR